MNGTHPDKRMDSVKDQVRHPFVLLNFMRGIASDGGARIVAARFGSMLGCFVAMILIAAPAGAAEFRTLDIGAPCDAVPAREQARGSVAIPWKTIPGADVYAFTEENSTAILSSCIFARKEVFSAETISFRSSSRKRQ